MSVLAEIARGVWESIRETLPTDAREGACFLAGMCYALLIYVGLLVVVSWATLTAVGAR